MTGKERYLAMVRGEPVDFVPRIPILMQFAADHIGATYGAFRSDHRVKVEGNVRCAEDFGLDVVGVMSDPYSETQGYGAEIVFLDRGVPRCLHPPLEASKDLSRLPGPNPLEAERMATTVRVVREYRARVGDAYGILGWVEGPAAQAANLRGMGQFMIDMMDDADWCCSLMDVCADVAVDFAKAQVEAGADTIGIGDAVASQLPPSLYQACVLPREKRRAVGSRVALAGNMDPVACVLQGAPAAIRERLRQDCEVAGNPFLVNAGCEIPPGTPAENLEALCEPLAWRP